MPTQAHDHVSTLPQQSCRTPRRMAELDNGLYSYICPWWLQVEPLNPFTDALLSSTAERHSLQRSDEMNNKIVSQSCSLCRSISSLSLQSLFPFFDQCFTMASGWLSCLWCSQSQPLSCCDPRRLDRHLHRSQTTSSISPLRLTCCWTTVSTGSKSCWTVYLQHC
jgi:hypothetical protein